MVLPVDRGAAMTMVCLPPCVAVTVDKPCLATPGERTAPVLDSVFITGLPRVYDKSIIYYVITQQT